MINLQGKTYLNVLELIGNYKKADLIPFLLSGRNYSVGESNTSKPADFEYPEDWLMDLNFKIVDIFKKVEYKEMTVKDKIKAG